MIRIYSATIFFVFELLISQLVYSDTILFSDETNSTSIGKYIEIFEDEESKLTLDSIKKSTLFKPSIQEIPNLGISSSTFWLKFSVKNVSKEKKLLLQIQHPIIDEITFYTILQEEKYREEKLGEFEPFHNRKYNHQDYIFDLVIPIGYTQDYYLKIKSGEQITVPIRIGTPTSIMESSDFNNIVSGIYYGIIIVMLLYNLFIYFAVKDKNYLYYVIYVFFVGLTQACLQGYAFKYLWPNSPTIAMQSMYWVPALVGIATAIFLQSFLELKINHNISHKILNGFIVIYLIAITASILQFFKISQTIIQLNAMIGSFYILSVGVLMYRRGYKPAKYFLIAWSIFLTSVIVFVLKTFDIFPHNDFTYYILQIGSSAETVLLSFALADRINIFKKEKEEAQARELQERREKQDILVKQAETLQIKVNEATEELKEKNIALNDTLAKLKTTQAELVQKQKMASLGQLAAGVAHEVNNPINIISSSLDIIERDFSEMKECIDKFQSIDSSVEDIIERVKESQDFAKEEIEYEEVVKEVDTAMERARRGVSRTASITQELKNFTKIDTEGFTITQINKDIDAMLDILKLSLGDIEVEKAYGDIPEIKCNSQRLNVLYQNILTNSIEAIQKKGMNGSKGKIKIETNLFEGSIVIAFTDNGVGMSKEVKEKAFDPFFSTKDVDSKGLGLANAYSTINEHNGKIEVDTVEGESTTLRLIIPVQQDQVA